MVLVEANFDFFIFILAGVTLVVLTGVVIERRKFINWFIALFFGTLGGLIYYLSNFNPNLREIADLVYLGAFFVLIFVSIMDYNNFLRNNEITKTKCFYQTILLSGILLPLSFILYFIFGNQNFSLSFLILLYTLLLVIVATIIYFFIIVKVFSITRMFFFLSIFMILSTNLATDISFFGIQLTWDLSYFFNIILYVFFLSCSLTVFFEDQFIKISSDLVEKDAMLQTFIELAPVGVIVFQNGKAISINTRMRNIYGFSLLELKNFTINDIISTFASEGKSQVEKSIKRALDPSTIDYEENFTAQFMNKEGILKWGEFHVKTTNFKGDQTSFVILIDISERLKLEETFKLAFLNSPNPIVLVDAQTEKFIIFNDKFLNLFGYTYEEMINQNFVNFSFPEDQAIQDKNYPKETMRKEGFNITTTKKYRKKNGTIIEALVSVSYIKVSEDVDYAITQLVDLTYLNEIEYYKKIIKSLEEANDELKNINQIVSHDVKAPLNSIINLLSLIELDKVSLSAELLSIFSQIKSKTIYTSNLVREILEYSGIGFYEEKLNFVNLKNLLEDIINSLNVKPNFSININQNLPNLNISTIRIQQIFQNLLSNAIKFNDKEKATIEISYSVLNDGMYEFYVEDNGIGIPKDEISSLFMVFKTIKKDPESTGLGLAIVKKIVLYYGGQVQISSLVGKHTKVSFTLPNRFIIK